MDKTDVSKISKMPAVIASIMLLLSFLSWSYGYYNLLRFAVTGVAIYYIYYLYKYIQRQNFWIWSLIIIAVLFNPVVPVYLYSKALWAPIDLVVAIFFIVLANKIKNNKLILKF